MAFAVDLLVCEATLQEGTESLEEGHLTAEQAGEIAAAAKIKKLLLSHIWGSLNPEVSKTQAKKIFGGEVEVGKENQRMKI
jgi:ribonuclease BN (tRNA processing enzyme)